MSLRDSITTVGLVLIIGGTYYLGLIDGYDRGSADGEAAFSKYLRAANQPTPSPTGPRTDAVLAANLFADWPFETSMHDQGTVDFLLEWRRKPTLLWAKVMDQNYQGKDARDKH